MSNAFDALHRGANVSQSRQEDAESAFENSRVKFVLQSFNLKSATRKVQDAGCRTDRRMTFHAFHVLYPTFPIRLGISILEGKALHRDPGSVFPVWLKTFNKLPFVTCEGVTQTGIVDQGVRAKAKARGVQVFAPIELIQSRGFDAERAIRDFVERFKTEGAKYLERFDEKRAAGANLSQLSIYYTTILTHRLRYVA